VVGTHVDVMGRRPLVLRTHLDPRPADEAAARPIRDAVNVPLGELAQRTHELPAPDVELPVAGPEEVAAEAAAWLGARGRRSRVEPDFAYGGDADGAVGRLWRPSAAVASVLAELPPGDAIDLGCGTGRDVVYAASLGWRVLGVDVLPDALERGAALAGRCAAAIETPSWRRVDLERAGWEGEIAERFDLVIVCRYLHRPLLAALPGLLRAGGSVVCEALTTVHRARHGRPAEAARAVAAGELAALLRGVGFEIQRHDEGGQGGGHTARVWGVLGEPDSSC
jgi:SAM-dependent methyltransferase